VRGLQDDGKTTQLLQHQMAGNYARLGVPFIAVGYEYQNLWIFHEENLAN